jgi:lipopolysaccharide transport system permease protein
METVREITSRKSLNFLNLKELWYYRELLFFLAWRDYKVRYKETVIGAAWAFFQPLLTMIVFVMFFGRFHESVSGGVPYPIFVYAGLFLWLFFSNAILSASNSFVVNNSIITKVYFPKILIPLSAITVHFVDLFFASIVLLILLFVYGYSLTLLLLIFLPLLILILTLATAGIGIFLGSLTVKYRDVKYITPFFVQLTLFLSPVIYSTSAVANYGWLIKLNPISGLIETFRALLFNSSLPVDMLVISFLVSALIFIASLLYFMFTEEQFSDIL